MYKTEANQPEFVDFDLPFSGRLRAKNRWVKLAELVPWDLVEQCYGESLADTGTGAPAKSARMAYGALLIKERQGITDEQTAQQVLENPYLQYFLGIRKLQEQPVYDPSMMVHFRSRFSEEHHRMINEQIIAGTTGKPAQQDQDE